MSYFRAPVQSSWAVAAFCFFDAFLAAALSATTLLSADCSCNRVLQAGAAFAAAAFAIFIAPLEIGASGSLLEDSSLDDCIWGAGSRISGALGAHASAVDAVDGCEPKLIIGSVAVE